MVKKRTSLDTILNTNKKEAEVATQVRNPVPDVQKSADAGVGKRPHVKQQALYLRLNVYKQLRLLAFEEERKMHDLCLEALDLLFANRGLPSINELLADDDQ